MKKKKKMRKDVLRKNLEALFQGRTLIFRRDPTLNSIVSGGTLANWDSLGTGIDGAVRLGNRTYYPVAAVIDRLLDISDAE